MPKDRPAQDKLALLELAGRLQNISAACKAMGFSRDSYYRIRKTCDEGGPEALLHNKNQTPHIGMRLSGAVEGAVLRVSRENPFWGNRKISERLNHEGIEVSPTGVRNVWSRHDISTLQKRVQALLRGENLENQIAPWPAPNKGKPAREGGLPPDSTQKDLLATTLHFERLIHQLSAQFIDLPYDLIDGEIERGQKLVCELLGIHRSVFGEFSADLKWVKKTHSWALEGIPFDSTDFANDEGEFSYVLKRLQKGEVLSWSDPEELPENLPKLKLALVKCMKTAAVVIPLKVGKSVLGLISWESYGVSRIWPDQLVERLVFISQVFGNAFSRKKTEQALRESLTEIRKLKDQLQEENRYLLGEIKLEHKHQGIVGNSGVMRKVLSLAEQVAGTQSTVLITGETGAGKELIAQQIHELSTRKERPMVSVNCTAFPQTLIESEMFGHEKGAFSGAVSRRIGRFELANHSTIFLDEIGDMPLELQPKLLRVVETGQFQRLGGSRTTCVDVRVIAATNRDLAVEAAEGRFRKDLFYRLNIFPIVVPPLRARREDIPLLVKAFAEDFSRRMGKQIESISKKNLDELSKYNWPGNVRELRNLVERAMIVARGKVLHIRLPETSEPGGYMPDNMDELQRSHILKVLEKCDWRVAGPRGAARLLGMNPTTLRFRMKKLKIQHEERFY